jgi:antitoxin component of RelBE/YafQ-DinJ toxin-antitoxin module
MSSKKKNKTHFLGVRINEKMRESLVIVSKDFGIPVSGVVKMILRQWIEKYFERRGQDEKKY